MTSITDVVHTDAVIVGSGIAGLTTALTLGDCTVISKTALGEGSSRWAQGGIAAAMSANDDPALHAADTVAVTVAVAVTDAHAALSDFQSSVRYARDRDAVTHADAIRVAGTSRSRHRMLI